MRIIYCFIVVFIHTIVSSGQSIENEEIDMFSCGNVEAIVYPQKMNVSDYEKEYSKFIEREKEYLKSNTIYTLPTVVHIIHDGAALGTAENPTDNQIFSQIQQATDRFRHMHIGAPSYTNPNYGVDTQIELCMAKIDPNGNYTSGVLRYYDPVNTINPSYAYMSSIMWDPSLYNNIIIAKDIGGACGIANGTFTWYLASCFNPGLICHEIGHHLSLAHTFSGNCTNNNCLTDGDKVCDTPPKPNAGADLNSYSCASPGNSCTTDDDDLSTNNPYRPVANGGIGDQPDMYANYMDYTGQCWNSFTQGQKDRMIFNLINARSNLYENASVCNGPPMASFDIGINSITVSQSDVCQKELIPMMEIKNYGTTTITSFTIEYIINGTLAATESINATSIVSGATLSYTASNPLLLNLGDEILSIRTTLPNGTADQNIYNDASYTEISYIGGDYCANFNSCQNLSSNTASGPGNVTTITVNGTFPSIPVEINSAYLCIDITGDISASSEAFNISIDGGNSIGLTNYGVDCDEAVSTCISVSVADYNTWTADNMIVISLDPITTFINPNLCITNQACVSLYVPQIQLDECDANDFEINGPFANEYIAKQYIKANGIINTGQNVKFQAGSFIELNEMFSIAANAVFEAIIEDCEEP